MKEVIVAIQAAISGPVRKPYAAIIDAAKLLGGYAEGSGDITEAIQQMKKRGPVPVMSEQRALTPLEIIPKGAHDPTVGTITVINDWNRDAVIPSDKFFQESEPDGFPPDSPEKLKRTA